MPEISCMSPKLRDEVLELLKDSGAPKSAMDVLREVPDCDKGVIKIRKGRAKGEKRAPSPYNVYIGNCMRGTGKSLSTCAAEYKKGK